MLNQQPIYANYLPNSKSLDKEGIVMSGSKWKLKDRWIVGWYWGGQRHLITRYKGRILYRTHPDVIKCYGRKQADKLLALLQSRAEEHYNDNCIFRIEEFTQKGWTDVIEFYNEWLTEVIEPKKKPATTKGYRSYLRNWIEPFFIKNPVMLHEIQLDTLNKLLNYIKLSGKGKLNVMMAFHAMMDYAWRSKRIPEIPPFPKREDYGLVEHNIKWLPEDRQMSIVDAIPEVHRPIFMWLKYHLRRPAEACALKWEDYDEINSIFLIRRSVSARKVVDSTKTGVEHIIPCHSKFKPYIKRHKRTVGGFLFTNPRARKDGKRYTNESLNKLWKNACRKVGEDIDMYSGLKHSSCSQYINEKGLSMSELQIITDHARLDSVKRYAKVEVARKRALMERSNIIPIAKKQLKSKKSRRI